MGDLVHDLDVLAVVLLDLRVHYESELRTLTAAQRLVELCRRSGDATAGTVLNDCLNRLGDLALANEAIRVELHDAIRMAEAAAQKGR